MGCTIENGRVMDQSGCIRCYVTCDQGYYRTGSIAYCNKTSGKWLDPRTNIPPCHLPGPPIKDISFPSRIDHISTIPPRILQHPQHYPTFKVPTIKIPDNNWQSTGSQTGGFGRAIGVVFGLLFLGCAMPALAICRKSRSQPGEESGGRSTTEGRRRRQVQIWVERETRRDELHMEELQREELRSEELLNKELQREELQREEFQREELLREEMQREELQREEQRRKEIQNNAQGLNESFGSGIIDFVRINREDQNKDVQLNWSACPNSPEPRGFPLPPPYDAESVFNPAYEMSESADLDLTHKPISETYPTPTDTGNEQSDGVPEATPPPYSEKMRRC